MQLFLAVIFMCAGQQCGFIYEPRPYNSNQACLAALHSELNSMKKNYPAASAHGVCLEVEFKAA